MALKSREVSADKLRSIFAQARCLERLDHDEIVALVGADREARAAHLPPGSRSQLVHYYERNGTKVAIVHQYVRPDGSLGASGKPDPKLVVYEDIAYKLARDE